MAYPCTARPTADNCYWSAPCDNGLFCDGAEYCDAAVGCADGPPPATNDGVGCTIDSCDEANDIVVHAANDGRCDNGLLCDGAERCDPVAGCQPGVAPQINDGVACTNDYCDELLGVVHAPDDGYCDNGQFCDGAERCDPMASCQPGAPPNIDDGVGCTVDSCDEANDVVVHDFAACGGEHISEAFIGANVNPPGEFSYGCSYADKHAFNWDNLGSMTWKDCMIEASRRGAMLMSQQYTVVGGWNTHRNGNNVMWSQWSNYQSANLGTSRACIIARDKDAITNDAYLPNARTYDNNLWIYQDLGTRYYDECQEAAGNAGASIITPGTIGTGSGDNYWVNSVHMCNTYQWISGGGTAYSSDNVGVAVRSSQHSCMIGYMGLPHECRRAADNTVWCVAPDGTTSGNEMCRYPPGYAGTYYALSQAGADVHGLGQVQYSDCATNYVRPGGVVYGSTLGCWTNEMRWARELGGDYRNVVRCTNFE